MRSFLKSAVLIAVFAFSAAIGIVLQAPPVAALPSERMVRIVNQDSAGNSTVRFDIYGDAIDAHDGQIQKFGDTYYLYGTRYGCGFEWQVKGSPFCGFVSYSSPDLVNWKPRGPLFDASTDTWQQRCNGNTYGCYRPHVVHNRSTGKYVLWLNTYDTGVGFRVFTSSNPTSGFVEKEIPTLAVKPGADGGLNYGDEQVFVDDDGKAYLTATDWTVGGDLVVERLNSFYTSGSGSFTRIGLRSTEAPTIFKRSGKYYLTYSDPNRGYATTGTAYLTASNPLGPWQGSGRSEWFADSGALNIDGGGIGLSKDGASWGDYVFSATVTPQPARKGGYAQVGMVFRSSSAGSYQWLIGNYPHQGFEGGNLTKLLPGQPPSFVKLPFPVEAGQSYDVAIAVHGSTIETRINGQLVDTTTNSALTAGRVGFREDIANGEKASIERARVTDLDGRVLLDDEFATDLTRWEPPTSTTTGTNISTTSCGGQPADVLPIKTAQGIVYLYQSDVWMNGAPNEALARHHWEPLRFDASGGIQPLQCGAAYDVKIPVGSPSVATGRPTVSAGDAGFRVHADIMSVNRNGLARAQTFTVPKAGKLKQIKFGSFQTGHPDQPLILEVRRLDPDGSIGTLIAAKSFAVQSISWAAQWLTFDLPSPVSVGAQEELAIVARSNTATGAYGMLYSDTTPYARGAALVSRDDGSSWATESQRVLRFSALVRK